MICQAIQPANSKSPRNTKKHPTTPNRAAVLPVPHVTLAVPTAGGDSNRHATGPLAASLARLPIGGQEIPAQQLFSERDVPVLQTT